MLDLNEVAIAALFLDAGKMLMQAGLDRDAMGDLGYSEAVCETALGGEETVERDRGDALAPAVVARGAARLASNFEQEGVDDSAAPLRPVLDVVGREGRGPVDRGWAYLPTEYAERIGAHLPLPPGSVRTDPEATRRLMKGLLERLGRRPKAS